MYPGNVYIQNHSEINATTGVDTNVRLDIFDSKHGLQHNDLARAQYKHWRSVETGADLLSHNEKKLLGLI